MENDNNDTGVKATHNKQDARNRQQTEQDTRRKSKDAAGPLGKPPEKGMPQHKQHGHLRKKNNDSSDWFYGEHRRNATSRTVQATPQRTRHAKTKQTANTPIAATRSCNERQRENLNVYADTCSVHQYKQEQTQRGTQL